MRISQTFGRIGMYRTPARLQMESGKARLELKRHNIEIEIHRELPRVEIDQREAFAGIGLKSILDLSREAWETAYRRVMEYIAKVSREGDRLAAIEGAGNTIAEIAEENAYPQDEGGESFTPYVRPRVSVSGGVTINVKRGRGELNKGVETVYHPGYLKISYTPSKLRVFMLSYPAIKISHENPRIDAYV